MMRECMHYYAGKKVLVTGHTGFKGSWLCEVLSEAGAEVTGFALEPPTVPNLFTLASIDSKVHSIIGDVRDLGSLRLAFQNAQPEIVFHLAAQPLVRASYSDPVYTYETNVMGTVNVLECVREFDCVRSFLNVTTDKVYLNKEWCWGYRETDPLDGFDPYSNSKSCSELVTHSYRSSFFGERDVSVSTARAGNVIGGGDYAEDRIIPDCVRAALAGQTLVVRNPHSIRPYQHVLEPLFAYLLIAKRQQEEPDLSGAYNVGPDDCDCVSTGDLVELFRLAWGGDFSWTCLGEDTHAPHEASFLRLDSSKLKTCCGWRPRWRIAYAIEKTVEWVKACSGNDDIQGAMRSQIEEYTA